MRRWLVLSLGISIATLAGYALLTGAAPSPGAHAEHGPHDEISDESRERLREILRDAGSEEVRTP